MACRCQQLLATTFATATALIQQFTSLKINTGQAASNDFVKLKITHLMQKVLLVALLGIAFLGQAQPVTFSPTKRDQLNRSLSGLGWRVYRQDEEESS